LVLLYSAITKAALKTFDVNKGSTLTRCLCFRANSPTFILDHKYASSLWQLFGYEGGLEEEEEEEEEKARWVVLLLLAVPDFVIDKNMPSLPMVLPRSLLAS
jgi:hypothetical protein